MHLLPREADKLILHQTGFLAQKRLARGLRLNLPEATALIASQILELIRDGQHSVACLMGLGMKILGKRHVIPGVEDLIHQVQVEGTFPDGTKLVTVHYPIASESVDLNLALYGTFLPIPDDHLFDLKPEEEEDLKLLQKQLNSSMVANDSSVIATTTTTNNNNDNNIDEDSMVTDASYSLDYSPGQVIVHSTSYPIILNKNKPRTRLEVTNNGDRPIQVGSHYHFIETNAELVFDRLLSLGKRLDIPAGTAVRFEPGETKIVHLVDISGKKIIKGGNGLATGCVDDIDRQALKAKIRQLGFGDIDQSPEITGSSHDSNNLGQTIIPCTMDRYRYADAYGPTVGDRIRLADSALLIEIEKDFTEYGNEVVFGGGKVIRSGMGQCTGIGDKDALDLVITNAVILDYTGIYKADIGIKNGFIRGIGKAGNPDIMDGVHPDMIIGVTTEVCAGEGLILTAGAVDTHIHFICPQLCYEALASGITTLVGGGTGPNSGTKATTCTPGKNHIEMMLKATDDIPMNFGFTGKGNTSSHIGLEDQILAGVVGLKLHEDWGTTPAAIDACLEICEKYDVQATIHTDTLNESGFVESSIGAFKGRTIHAYHSEGAGGGHAPDIIRVCGEENVIPSSTNPTRPSTVNTLDEHLDMLMVCHHLSQDIPEDIAFAESRIRGETIGAEDYLQDIGAISIISSDSQAMGRVGEVVCRTWQTADKMKKVYGPYKARQQNLEHDQSDSHRADNFRVKRYVAKYTINPSIAHGVSHLVGSIEVGKLADLVLYRPEFFGTKPEIVMKGGQIVWSQMGDANASIPTPQPVISRPMFGAYASAIPLNSFAFVSKISLQEGFVRSYGLKKRTVPVTGCRQVKKKDMKLNNTRPSIQVDPETYEVTVDGYLATVEPASTVPMSKLVSLF